jgi:hypothetical protein
MPEISDRRTARSFVRYGHLLRMPGDYWWENAFPKLPNIV